MGSNTLDNRTDGETIVQAFFNDIHSAMNGDFVGRNSSGVATSGQNLGTVALPWGAIRCSSLIIGGDSVDPALTTRPQNIVLSGKTRSTSTQPAFIVPNGAAASATIIGTSVNLSFDCNGSEVTVSSDLSLTSLTTAPSSNNTCLVNDSGATSGFDTRFWGEPLSGKDIAIDTIGTEISSLNGKWAAFKTSTEYFLALIDTTNNKLTKCKRGFFYDSSSAPINPVTLADNATITLMKLGWVFVQSNGTTTDVTYTNPTWGAAAPSSPVTGEYWYDTANATWKRYDGASFQIINRTFIGMVVIDSSNCVAARSVDFYKTYSPLNTFQIEKTSNTQVRASTTDSKISVDGVSFYYGNHLPFWDITSHLATSADMISSTEQASRVYYLYIKETGAVVLSDIAPMFFPEKFGYYFRHNPWRCVGQVVNNGSSNFSDTSQLYNQKPTFTWYTSGSGTYYTPIGCTRLAIRGIGGGGGGGGSASGTAGTSTTFGALTLGGGDYGAQGNPGAAGAGGTVTNNLINFNGIAVNGLQGVYNSNFSGSSIVSAGGMSSIFGHCAGTPGGGNSGGAASTNSGCGGSGGSATSGNSGGSGGGMGAVVQGYILNPLMSYAYGIGSKGTGGSGGGGIGGGGNGADGCLELIAFFD